MRRAILTGAAILAAIVPLACGESDESDEGQEAQIAAAIESFESALRSGDTTQFCKAIAPGYVEEIGGLEACAKGFEKDLLFAENVQIRNLEVDETDIDGDSAVVTLTNGEFQNVVKEDGEWYVEPFAPPEDATAPAATVPGT